MWQNEIPEDRNHEGISSVGQEAVDPRLEAAAESELRTEHLVFAENEKQDTHGDAQQGKNDGISIGVCVHGFHAIEALFPVTFFSRRNKSAGLVRRAV